jgi:hypothetical protein
MKKLLFSLFIISFSSLFGMQQQAISTSLPHISNFVWKINEEHEKNFAPNDQEYKQLCGQIIQTLSNYGEPDHLKIHLDRLKKHSNTYKPKTKPYNISEIKIAAQNILDEAKKLSIQASGAYACAIIRNPSDSASNLKEFGEAQVKYYNAYVNNAYVQILETIMQQQTAVDLLYIFDFVQFPNPRKSNFHQFEEYKRLRNILIWSLVSCAKSDHIKDLLDKLKFHCKNSGMKPRNIEIKAAAQVTFDNAKKQSTQMGIAYDQEKVLNSSDNTEVLKKSEELKKAEYNKNYLEVFDMIMQTPELS